VAEVPQEAAQGLSPEDAEQLRTAIQGGRGQDEAEIRADERRRVAAEQDAAGLVVTGVCACGQPLGTCPCCGDSRCWRCDPSKDTNPAAETLRALAQAIDDSAGNNDDPLADAIWTRCGREDGLPATVDDPRTIAMVAYKVCASLLAGGPGDGCCG
jgi:hypothetical protein